MMMKMKEGTRLMSLLACVGVVVCIVFPLGEMAYPDVVQAIGAFPFAALEAVVAATLGFGLFEVLFG
jgi:hypothetical protein